jgi:hypothetical protein
MKKYKLILLLAALFLISIPASARSEEKVEQDTHFVYLPFMVRMEKVGERLDIFESGSQTFPANTPFHVVHGWQLDADEEWIELFDFQVAVDGVFRELSFFQSVLDDSQDPPILNKRFVYNFPEGMTGTHLFTGHWIAPCFVFYDDCEDPYELYEAISEVDVTFVH